MATDRDLVGLPSEGDLVKPDKPKEEAPPERTTRKRAAPSRSTKAAQLDAIRPALTSGFVLLGAGLSPALPLTGKAVVYQAEELTTSLIQWGKTSPRIAKILLTAGKTGGAFGFMTAAAPIGIAVLVELRQIGPDAAMRLLPEDLHQFIPPPVEHEWPGGEGNITPPPTDGQHGTNIPTI